MQSHVIGFPRIGTGRELKKAVEGFWSGKLPESQLIAIADELKEKHWKIQAEAGLDFVSVGDFSFYDQVLDTAVMLNIIPERFACGDSPLNLTNYFHLARGDSSRNIPAMEMTKWFDTNYHYIVPEFTGNDQVRYSSTKLVDETRAAVSAGFNPKPVLLGPITFLSLGKCTENFDRWSLLPSILSVYQQVIKELSQHCEWIQIDEPILCTDISDEAEKHFIPAITALNDAAGNAKLLLASYFGPLKKNLPLALEAPTAGVHFDLIRGASELSRIVGGIPKNKILSAGLINGRNIWKTDLTAAGKTLKFITETLGSDNVIVGSSCSLLHVPVDLAAETKLDFEIKSWLAFAVQKCHEISTLKSFITGEDVSSLLAENLDAVNSRRTSQRVNIEDVQERIKAVTSDQFMRQNPYSIRKYVQAKRSGLPFFPTTTIGSFPQTEDIRKIRRRFKKNEISLDEYNAFIKNEIRSVIDKQNEIGLDVLVHGEAERNDMVEYFGEQLAGFCFTENGWVQSYGSRCVKPPVIYGDIYRPAPMTVEWSSFAQTLTDKRVKGMLTGPITIACWSFVRDDINRRDVCRQIALAIRDEVQDLEASGIRMIQVDEAAWSEGMPVRKSDAETYFAWAVDCFRLATAVVRDETQIHTHMCYSEFNEIIPWIAKMDADVISIESSRSGMELLNAFKRFDYQAEIGPGVYDIHSPRVPTTEEILSLLRKILAVLPPEQIWINPDCGLKTRGWPETITSLQNMVAAAKILRKEYL